MKSANLFSTLWKSTLIIGVVLGLISCASTQEKIDPQTEYSGYLKDYSKIKEAEDGAFAWISEDLEKGHYTKILLHKVELYPKNMLKDNPNADLIRATVEEFDKAFAESISTEFKLVNKPGPGVLRIRVALTNTKNNVKGMTGWEILPIGAIVGGAQAATGTRPRIVQILLEAEFLDSISNKRLGIGVKKATATQEERTQITQEDFMKLVHKFSAETGKNLAKVLK